MTAPAASTSAGARAGPSDPSSGVDEHAVDLDREHSQLGGVAGHEPVGEGVGMLSQERRGGLHREMLAAVGLGGVAEPPAADTPLDQFLVAAPRLDLGCGKHSTVVAAACLWPMLVDRARAVYEHGAAPTLVVPQQDVARGQPGRREQELRGYPAEGPRFAGTDVDEVRRRTTGDALAARHVGCAFLLLGASRAAQPGGEPPGGKIRQLAGILDAGRCRVVTHGFTQGTPRLGERPPARGARIIAQEVGRARAST